MSDYPEYAWIGDSIKETWQEAADVYSDIRRMKGEKLKFQRKTDYLLKYFTFPEN